MGFIRRDQRDVEPGAPSEDGKRRVPRRGFIAALTGLVVGGATQVVGVQTAQADDGQPLLLGTTNQENSTTSLLSLSTTGAPSLVVNNQSGDPVGGEGSDATGVLGGDGTGVLGLSKVSLAAVTPTGYPVGLRGLASAGAGVLGESDSAIGVLGLSAISGPGPTGETHVGVFGLSGVSGPGPTGETNIGVLGLSAISGPRASGYLGLSTISGPGPTGETNIGVLGLSKVSGPGASGVILLSAISGPGPTGEVNVGILGLSAISGPGPSGETHVGVLGLSGLTGRSVTLTANVGVYGASDLDAGVRAESLGQGPALDVIGPMKLSRSGLVTIAYPNKTASISGVPVTPQSVVFATIQTFRAGVYVAAAVPSSLGTGDGFTIYLNKAPGSRKAPRSVTVAWFVVERP